MSTRPPKRKQTPRKHNQLLKQQSTKIQTKLDTLRQQIAQKKKQKKINDKKDQIPKSTQSTDLFRRTDTNYSTNNSEFLAVEKFLTNGSNQNKFNKLNRSEQKEQPSSYLSHVKQLLASLKLPESIFQNCLKQRKIQTIERFLQTSQQQIDQWKQIAIGHRVKLKKFIRVAHEQNKKNNSTIHNQTGQNIEDIVNRREKNRVFIKISDREQQNWDEQEENQKIQEQQQKKDNQHSQKKSLQDEQDIMISSLNEAFFGSSQQRKSIIKNSKKQSGELNSPKTKKQVRWNKNVKEYDRSNRKVLTQKTTKIKISHYDDEQFDEANNSVQLISKQKDRWHKSYCWNCLKQVKNIIIYEQQSRNFCSEMCKVKYKQMTELDEAQNQEQIYLDKDQYEQTIDLSVL